MAQRGGVLAGEDGLDQLQVANRRRVEHQPLPGMVKAEPVHMLQAAALGFLDIVDDGRGGAGGPAVSGQAQPIESDDAEMRLQLAAGEIRGEDPILQRRQRRPRRQRARKRRRLAGMENLPRPPALQLLAQFGGGVRAGAFGDAKFPGRDFQQRQADGGRTGGDGGQIADLLAALRWLGPGRLAYAQS